MLYVTKINFIYVADLLEFTSVLLFNKISNVMIYAVKNVKSDVICVMPFNIVYNFSETLLKHLKSVLQCLNVDFNTGQKYALCAFGVP